MDIFRVLNNNVVIILDEKGQEKIVCGKGIAFKKRAGDALDMSLIQKTFILEDADSNHKFQQLLIDIPMEYIQVSDDIIQMAFTMMGKKMNESLIIALSDHIYTSIRRLKEGLTIRNGMLWEIKRFYEDEFKVGKQAIKMISERFNVDIPIDEAGFIAIHLVNAEMDDSSVEEIFQITQIMQELSTIVKYYFNIEFDTDSVYYYRFITHLKFFAQRLLKNCPSRGNEDGLLDLVKDKYPQSYLCVNKINEYLINKYMYELSKDEELYLTIHIERMIQKSNG